MNDEERKDGEEARPLPYPLPGGASGIVWEQTRPATVEEIERALDNMEDPEHWLQPSAENLAVLMRDAFLILDTDPDGTAGDLVDRLYPVFAGVATYEQRLALIDEAFVRSFADGAWPVSLATLTVLERDPVLIAVCAALYAAHILRDRDDSSTYEDLAGVLAYAEEQSWVSFAATIMGFVALGVPDFLDDLAPFRDDLDDDDVAVICGIPLVNPGLATLVFFLDWMEEAQRRHEHARFAMLAAAVASWGAASSAPVGGRRHCLEADDLRLQVCYRPQLLISRDQLARQIRPRLDALAKSETGSRAIAPVLAAWGERHKVEAV